jgi:hypothetical protein
VVEERSIRYLANRSIVLVCDLDDPIKLKCREWKISGEV